MTMLVVGSAECLYADVERALQLRPLASLMLVNGACTAIENAEHVLAGHEEKAEFFAEARRAKFPNAPPWRLHGAGPTHRRSIYAKMCPSVTDWWPEETGVAATSASKAAKIGMLMGFKEIILCGCPMNQPGYFPGESEGIPQDVSCLRIGDGGEAKRYATPHGGNYSTKPGEWMKVQETKIIRSYRERLSELAKTDFKGKVFSMSGFTRDCLGEPTRG